MCIGNKTKINLNINTTCNTNEGQNLMKSNLLSLSLFRRQDIIIR